MNEGPLLHGEEVASEAVRNLRERFTWVGVGDGLGPRDGSADRSLLQDSVDQMIQVFPWLAMNLNGEAALLAEQLGIAELSPAEQHEMLGLPEDYHEKTACWLQEPAAEAVPACGADTELDDETVSLILKLNAPDVAVHKAALERFMLQEVVLAEAGLAPPDGR